MKLILLTVLALAASSAHAAVPSLALTPAQEESLVNANLSAAASDPLLGSFERVSPVIPKADRLPWAEYQKAGYLLVSGDSELLAGAAKHAMAKNLPPDMTMVIFTGTNSASYQKALFQEYAQDIDPSRLKVIYLANGVDSFWARDEIGVPTWTLDANGNKKFGIVDARYYHDFENDAAIAQFFEADLIPLGSYFHEGGNFLANEDGECIVVNNKRAQVIPDVVFQMKYGCQKMLRLPFIKGIGHVDESVKFIDRKTVITDDPTYQVLLQEAGYTVVMMPRAKNKFETYINSVIINGTAFVPIFNEPTDAEAEQVYQSFGLKVIPLDSTQLSNQGEGSLHCITMVYPPGPFDDTLGDITAKDF